MQRGDLVSVAINGDFDKNRPALAVKLPLLANHTSITVFPTISAFVNSPLLLVTVPVFAKNHLEKISQIITDKAMTFKCEKIGPVLGRVNADELTQVERGLAVFLGIAK